MVTVFPGGAPALTALLTPYDSQTPLRPGTTVVFPNTLPTSRGYPADLPASIAA